MSNPKMNAAKCLKCGDSIESKTLHDHARCRCGNVSVCGGKENPIIRGSEYVLTGSVEEAEELVQSSNQSEEEDQKDQNEKALSKEDLLYSLECFIDCIKKLPRTSHHGPSLSSPISNEDFVTVLSILAAFLRSS